MSLHRFFKNFPLSLSLCRRQISRDVTSPRRGPIGGKNRHRNRKLIQCETDAEKTRSVSLERTHLPWSNLVVYLRLKQKNRKTDRDTFVCTFICLSVVSFKGVHPMTGRSSKLHRNLSREERGGKNLGSTNKYVKFGS